jgi:hypothetical protein
MLDILNLESLEPLAPWAKLAIAGPLARHPEHSEG